MARLRSAPLWQRLAAQNGLACILAGAAIFSGGAHTLYFHFLAGSSEAPGLLAWDPFGLARFAAGCAVAYYGTSLISRRQRLRRTEPAPEEDAPQSHLSAIIFCAALAIASLIVAAGADTLIARFRSEAIPTEPDAAASDPAELDPGWPSWDTMGLARLAVGGVVIATLLASPLSRSGLGTLTSRVQRRLDTPARSALALSLAAWFAVLTAILILPLLCGIPRGHPVRPADLEEQLSKARAKRDRVSNTVVGIAAPQERKKLQPELDEAQAKFRTLFDLNESGQTMPQWLWIHGPKGAYGYVWDILRLLLVVLIAPIGAHFVRVMRGR